MLLLKYYLIGSVGIKQCFFFFFSMPFFQLVFFHATTSVPSLSLFFSLSLSLAFSIPLNLKRGYKRGKGEEEEIRFKTRNIFHHQKKISSQKKSKNGKFQISLFCFLYFLYFISRKGSLTCCHLVRKIRVSQRGSCTCLIVKQIWLLTITSTLSLLFWHFINSRAYHWADMSLYLLLKIPVRRGVACIFSYVIAGFELMIRNKKTTNEPLVPLHKSFSTDTRY